MKKQSLRPVVCHEYPHLQAKMLTQTKHNLQKLEKEDLENDEDYEDRGFWSVIHGK